MSPHRLESAAPQAFDEHSDVHEHARRAAERSDTVREMRDAISEELRTDHYLPAAALPAAAHRRAPPPPPPPRAAAVPAAERSRWFTPSLLALVASSVMGVLALLRAGPAANREPTVRSLPTTAAAAASEPAVAAEQAPVVEEAAQPSAIATDGSEDEAAPQLAQPATRSKYANVGVLRLRSNVPAAVYVDGHHVGNTPLRSLRLRPGTHLVGLENAVTDQRAKFAIEVGPGDFVQRRVRLTRAAP